MREIDILVKTPDAAASPTAGDETVQNYTINFSTASTYECSMHIGEQ